METCWFCGTRPADSYSALEVHLRGKAMFTRKTGFKQYTTTYDGRLVKVPRCKECALNHRKRREGIVIPTILGTMGVLSLLFAYTYPIYGLGDILFVLGDIGIVAFVLLSVRLGIITKGTPNESKKLTYPAVQALRKQGFD